MVCKSLGDERYLVADLNVDCDSATYRDWLAVNLVLIVVVNLLIPSLIYYWVYKLRFRRHSVDSKFRVGFVYQFFKDNRQYFWLTDFSLKIGIILINYLFYDEPIVKCQLMISWIIGYLFCIIKQRPFLRKIHNRLLKFSCILNLVCAIYILILM